ncbi:MAG: D-glycerate dehydrogenase [Candidatus Heimdallarchaeota archaeon]|nr:MAG: D-glycerate dehydrogenase [Candidatus Heimdallarchaeota archaeon]
MMNSRPLVLCTHSIPETGLNILKKSMDIKILDETISIKSQLQELLPTADFLIPLLSVDITEDLMDLAPSLRGIANYAVGYNNIDINSAKKRNILVTNTPDVLTNATADLVWGLILTVTRRIVEGDTICRDNKFPGWLPKYLLGFEITGKTLGIIGLGRIGTAVAKRAYGFDMRVLYHSRTRKHSIEAEYNLVFKENLKDVLKEADIISINVPYTSETHHLISEREFEIMKPSAYLINTARGKVINEKVLINALKNKVIAGAALDVFYDEPSIPTELRELKNVVLTPHIGSATTQARNAMAKMVADNILAIERGDQPPNLIPELK